MLALWYLPLIAAQAGPPEMDAEQLARVIAGLHAPIKDVEMVCEGTVHFLDETDPKYREKTDRYNRQFQTRYAYRASDGAAFEDIYMRNPKSDALLRTTMAVIGGKRTRSAQASDRRPGTVPPGVDNGYAASLYIAGSTQRFIFIWEWLPFIKDPTTGAWTSRVGRKSTVTAV